MTARAALCALALVAAAAGCAPVPPDPEEQIAALLDEIELASRESDLRGIKATLSDDYADAAGRRRSDIEGLVNAYYLRGSRVYLLLRPQEIDVTDDEQQASARVLAGMARVPVDDWQALRRTQGDAYVFDLELAQEDPGTWRVTSATWEPATLDDLL